MASLKSSLITGDRNSLPRHVKNRLIMAEITHREGPAFGDDGSDGQGILSPPLQIRLSYYRDTTDGQQDWAAMTKDERDALVWAATHGVLVDGTVYEVTNFDASLLRDLEYL